MLKIIKSLIYELPTEEEFEKVLIKQRKKVDGLRWRRVEFVYVENKMRDKFQICYMKAGQTAKYKLARSCEFPWSPIANPSGGTWEYAKDKIGNEYFRLLRGGRIASNTIKISKG